MENRERKHQLIDPRKSLQCHYHQFGEYQVTETDHTKVCTLCNDYVREEHNYVDASNGESDGKRVGGGIRLPQDGSHDKIPDAF